MLLFVKYCHVLINIILLKVVNWRNWPLRILFTEDLGILSLELEIKINYWEWISETRDAQS